MEMAVDYVLDLILMDLKIGGIKHLLVFAAQTTHRVKNSETTEHPLVALTEYSPINNLNGTQIRSV